MKRKKEDQKKDIASEYKIQESNVQYLVRLIDKHGFDILRGVKYKYYSPSEKERIKVKLKGLSPVNYRLQSSN